MEPLETIEAQIAELKPALQSDHHITEFDIFGSYVRGEQTEANDVNILVEFDPSFRFSLVTYGRIEKYIAATLGEKVDPIMKNRTLAIFRSAKLPGE